MSSDLTSMMNELCKVSNFYGADDEFVIAGGGNTSVKTADRLWVKASGTELATITPEGFVQLERAPLAELLVSELPEESGPREEAYKQGLMGARVEPERGQRPSVESLMHHAIPATYVVHTHSTVMNQLTCSQKGEALARELYGDAIVWIPFVDPGYILSLEIEKRLQAYREAHGAEPRAVLMQNHGIIVAGESMEQVQAETRALLAPLLARMEELTPLPEAPASRADDPLVQALREKLVALGAVAGSDHVTFSDAPAVRRFVNDADGATLAGDGPLSPDQIVYCKSFPLWFDPRQAEGDAPATERLAAAWQAHTEKFGYAPKVVLVAGLGLFTLGDSERNAGIVSRVYLDAIQIMLGARRLGGVRYLSQRDREFIDNWEVEQYRRKISAQQKA